MPHFIIHCNKEFIDRIDAEILMQSVFEHANDSGLFTKSIIKVRIIPFEHSIVDGKFEDLIHIVAWIMGGRSAEQQKDLADNIVRGLKDLFPKLTTISIDIRDIDPQTYSNKDMVG